MLRLLHENPEYKTPDLLRSVKLRVEKLLPQCNMQELCEILCWTVRIMNIASSGFLAEIVSDVVPRIEYIMHDLQIIDLLQVGQALVAITSPSVEDGTEDGTEYRDGTGGGYATFLSRRGTLFLNQIIPNWVSFLQSYHSRLNTLIRNLPPEIHDFCLRSCSDDAPAQAVVSVLRILAYTVVEIPRDVEEKLMQIASIQARRYDNWQFGMSLWSLATLRHTRRLSFIPRDIISITLERGVDIMPTLLPRHIANSLWALGLLSYGNFERSASTVLEKFIVQIEDRLITLTKNALCIFELRHVVNIFWGFAKLNFRPKGICISGLMDRVRCLHVHDWGNVDFKVMIFALNFFGFENTHPFVELVLTQTQHVTTLGVLDLIEGRSEAISGELDSYEHVMDEKRGVAESKSMHNDYDTQLPRNNCGYARDKLHEMSVPRRKKKSTPLESATITAGVSVESGETFDQNVLARGLLDVANETKKRQGQGEASGRRTSDQPLGRPDGEVNDSVLRNETEVVHDVAGKNTVKRHEHESGEGAAQDRLTDLRKETQEAAREKATTAEGQMEQRKGLGDVSLVAIHPPAHDSCTTRKNSHEHPLPDGWEERISARTSTTYYYNKLMNVSSWQRPLCDTAFSTGATDETAVTTTTKKRIASVQHATQVKRRKGS
jgi:hypothetical protein